MKRILIQLIFFASLLALWQISVTAFNIPEYLFPAPLEISKQFVNYSLFLKHTYITLLESISGFVLGAIFAFLIALGINYSKLLEILIHPFLMISQTTPRIAIAPFLIIWFGHDLIPKIIIAAIMSFFPIVVNTVKGFRSADSELLELMDSYGATRTETLIKVKIPGALPYIFVALKLAITFSVIGAVVGEFVGADEGLGYLILQGNVNLDTSLMFAALFVLSIMGIVLYKIIGIIEKKVLYWHASEINGNTAY